MTVTIGSGIGSSVGSAAEPVWGVWTSPTKWYEHESVLLKWIPKRLTGKGLYNGGDITRRSQRQQTTSTVTGDLKGPVYYKGMGQFFGLTQGSLAGNSPVQQAATAAWSQTHARSSDFGDSLSLQVGMPDTGTGTIHQYNFRGLKAEQAVFECGVDEYLEMTLTLDGQGYDKTGAYAAPSYQISNGIFAFEQSQFRMGSFGSEVIVEGLRKWTLTLKRPHKVDSFYQDGTGLKQQQVQNAYSEITLALETDYLADPTFVAQFEADTNQSVIIDFIGPQIATGASHSITGVSNAATGMVVTVPGHGLANGQTAAISGVLGSGSSTPPGPNGTWVVGNVTTNTFTIGVNGTGFTYSSGGSAQLVYAEQVSFQIPSLNWDSEPPTIAGPDIIQPNMQLSGNFDDVHVGCTIAYMSTDTTL